MVNRSRIAPALLATLITAVSLLGSALDFSTLERTEPFNGAPIVNAYLPPPTGVVNATSSVRESFFAGLKKRAPLHALIGLLTQPTLAPRFDRIIGYDLSQPWQTQSVSAVCDRAPPERIFG